MDLRLIKIIGVVCCVVFIAIPASISFAQSSGAEIPNLVQDVWTAIQKAGTASAMIMFYMWVRSETERRKLQDERDGLLERVLTGMNNSTTAIRDLGQLFGTRRDGQ